MKTKNKFLLFIIFGNDQVKGIDRLIDEMKAEGTIIDVQKVPFNKADATQYLISFLGSYSIYLFGRRQGNLIEYIMKQTN